MVEARCGLRACDERARTRPGERREMEEAIDVCDAAPPDAGGVQRPCAQAHAVSGTGGMTGTAVLLVLGIARRQSACVTAGRPF